MKNQKRHMSGLSDTDSSISNKSRPKWANLLLNKKRSMRGVESNDTPNPVKNESVVVDSSDKKVKGNKSKGKKAAKRERAMSKKDLDNMSKKDPKTSKKQDNTPKEEDEMPIQDNETVGEKSTEQVYVIDSDDIIDEDEGTIEYEDIFLTADDEEAKRVISEFDETKPPMEMVTPGTVFKKYRGQARSVPTPSVAIMEYIVAPLPLERFQEKYTGKQPLLISRGRDNKDFYTRWLSEEGVRNLLQDESLEWGIDYSVHKYDADLDQRIDYAKGELSPLEMFQQGCSIRFYSPQSLVPSVWSLTALFEEYWGSIAGNNIYYTPSEHQGFAPHWDDVDAYLLQLSGSKSWKLWPPIKGCYHPRYYSEDFKYSDLEEETYQFKLEAGDLLYIPRGWVHAGVCGDEASLHMTLSIGYRHTWADLMRKYADINIKYIEERNSQYRKTLPRDIYRNFGSRHYYCLGSPFIPINNMSSDEIMTQGTDEAFCNDPVPLNVSKDSKNKKKQNSKKGDNSIDSSEEEIDTIQSRRACIANVFRDLFKQAFDFDDQNKAITDLPLDETVDRMALEYNRKRLPTTMPVYLRGGTCKRPKNYDIESPDDVSISPLDNIRLVHPNCFYIMNRPINTEDEKTSKPEEETLYLITNTTEDLGEGRSSLELPLGAMGALLDLQKIWPQYKPAKDVPLVGGDEDAELKCNISDSMVDDKCLLIEELYREGIIEIKGE